MSADNGDPPPLGAPALHSSSLDDGSRWDKRGLDHITGRRNACYEGGKHFSYRARVLTSSIGLVVRQVGRLLRAALGEPSTDISLMGHSHYTTWETWELGEKTCG